MQKAVIFSSPCAGKLGSDPERTENYGFCYQCPHIDKAIVSHIRQQRKP